MDKILDIIQRIARETFENESLSIDINTGPDDIEEWDSITHIQFISSIESEYNIKFTFDELLNNSNMGDIAKSILSKSS